MPFKIRVDTEYLQSGMSIVPMLRSMSESFDQTAIIVREKSPKDHYHCYIEPNCTEKTCRKNLRKIMTEGGNKALSVSSNHDNWKGYVAYCFKHKDTEVVHKGTDWPSAFELHQYYHENYNVKNVECKDSAIQSVLRYMEDNNKEFKTVRELYHIVIGYYRSKGKLLNKAHINMLVLSVYLQKNPEQDDDYIDSCMLEEDVLQMLNRKDKVEEKKERERLAHRDYLIQCGIEL